MSLLENFNDFNNNRILSVFNQHNYECLINSNNKIRVNANDNGNGNDNGNEIVITNYIDSGASAIIFKAVSNNNKQFALKFMSPQQEEIIIMRYATNLVKNNVTPHLIVLYVDMICQENGEIFDNIYIENPNLIERFIKKLKEINLFIQDGKYSLLIMELFDGDTAKLISPNSGIDPYIKTNIYCQIVLSLLTFHKYIGLHLDAHYKNFFYKKIKYNENEFFYYNIFGHDIFIRNCGYLIVLADYGLSNASSRITRSRERTLINDYNALLSEINNFYTRIPNVTSLFNTTGTEEMLIQSIISSLNDIFFIPSTLPHGAIILNKNPYII